MAIPEFGGLLSRAQRGDWSARDAVYALAFSRLHGIAARLVSRERRNHTLQPTALVGELFLKLYRLPLRIFDEDHFFRLSARAMRQVLVDHSRMKRQRNLLAEELVAELLNRAKMNENDQESIVTVRAVFDRLSEFDPVAARTVWLRSVEGFTFSQLGELQRREVWRVRADYEFGIKWLGARISRQDCSSKRARS